ncbi:MAG: hypothetical protein WAQ57_02535 [Candidatus Saccharimonadales bacterium]
MSKNVTKSDLNKLLGKGGLVLTVLLLVASALALVGHNFATSQVKRQLDQEKITFPAAGTAALSPEQYPGLQQYAGQPVDNGVKAKAYADEYIWVHMMKSSGGKSYAEISAQQRANPQDQKLSELKTSLFQGDMLRSSLLTAYAFSVFGMIAGYAAVFFLAAAGVVLLLSLWSFAKARK